MYTENCIGHCYKFCFVNHNLEIQGEKGSTFWDPSGINISSLVTLPHVPKSLFVSFSMHFQSVI